MALIFLVTPQEEVRLRPETTDDIFTIDVKLVPNRNDCAVGWLRHCKVSLNRVVVVVVVVTKSSVRCLWSAVVFNTCGSDK